MRYEGENRSQISFPLGGIGTGSIGIGGDGRLIDWEIFNYPAKGSINGYSHFAIKAVKDGVLKTYVISGDGFENLVGQYRMSQFTGFGFGPENKKMYAFPHFKNVCFDGEFPIARLLFSDEDFPGNVKLTAFNPFIPCDSKNSSIPAAFFEFEVQNTENCPIKYTLAASLSNPYECSKNEAVCDENVCGVLLENAACEDKNDLKYGNMCLASAPSEADVFSYWYRGSWRDGVVSYWNDFSSDAPMKKRDYQTSGKYDTCTVTKESEIKPGESKKFRFVISWSSPNRNNYWTEDENTKKKIWKNYYATVFENSFESALYSVKNFDSLMKKTLLFADTLHSSTLPAEVRDAASANLSVLKSPTALRLEDGSFYGWEGVFEDGGCCEGTCQHVYNYAYAMCFLFPDLERSIRDIEFKYSTDDNGKMSFRTMLPLGSERSRMRACLDGQMGSVIKVYREWKLSGDDEWLRQKWENVKKVLEYAWSDKNPDGWDRDKDGVLEGRQHHTLDVELFGPSSWLEGMYMAALKAAGEMASYLGDKEKAEEYMALFKKGYEYTRENLFSNGYFIQKIDIEDKSIPAKYEDALDYYWNDEEKQIKYQIKDGSSIDQLLAQWHADILGLGDIFDAKQVDAALASMMKNNFKESMRSFVNPWRIFAVYDESGSVICDYPEGVEKPKIPIPYCEETMTGFEYSFAGLLLSRGMIDEGLKVVRAVRDRFDGKKRNPWNEFECGSNYARSMASYALIPILSGFSFDIPSGYIGFEPYEKDSAFSCIWCAGGAYGKFSSDKNGFKLCVFEGSLSLSSFGAKFLKSVGEVKIDGKKTDFSFEDGIIKLDKAVISDCIEAGI